MANSLSHMLAYPILNARFTLPLSFRVAAGTPTDPGTPDTEFSIDGGATFADCAEEITTGGANGMGYLTLSGAETNNKVLLIAAKSANCVTTTAILHPRGLASVGTGTLSAGSSGGGTLGTLLAYDVTGCYIMTTGGTGGGGTGGANNQARRILTYNTGTGAFTCSTWETTPDATTTYSVLLPEGVTLGMLKALNSTSPIQTAGDIYSYLTTNLGALGAALSAIPKTGFKLASDGLASVTAWTVAITGNITGNLSGSIGSYMGNTAQTGDTFAKFAGITSLAQWLGALAGKQTGNSTARTEIRATGAGSGTFDETTDSVEALRDNMGTAQTGDSFARIGAPAGVSLAADVASVKTDTGTTIPGRLPAALTGAGNMKADALALSGDTVAADNAESFFDGTGYAGTNNVIPRVTLADTLTTYTGNTPQTGDSFPFADRVVGRGTVGTGSTATSIVTSALTPAGVSADQFKGRIIIFDRTTTTTALRGQATDITASSAASLAVLTATALTNAPVSGDTFSVL